MTFTPKTFPNLLGRYPFENRGHLCGDDPSAVSTGSGRSRGFQPRPSRLQYTGQVDFTPSEPTTQVRTGARPRFLTVVSSELDLLKRQHDATDEDPHVFVIR
jgi:hypothetical protein